MGEVNPPNMGAELRKKLAELENELAEGDITEKGYQKKKSNDSRAVPYTRDSGFVHASNPYPPAVGSSRPDSPTTDPSTPALFRRSSNHRYARDEVRYRSEIREEAVKEALQKDPLCLDSVRPSKRRQPSSCIPEPGPSHARSESESESSLDISSSQQHHQGSISAQSGPTPLTTHQQSRFLESADVFHKMSDPTPATKLANLRIIDGTMPTNSNVTAFANAAATSIAAASSSSSAISAAAVPLIPRVAQQPFASADNIRSTCPAYSFKHVRCREENFGPFEYIQSPETVSDRQLSQVLTEVIKQESECAYSCKAPKGFEVDKREDTRIVLKKSFPDGVVVEVYMELADSGDSEDVDSDDAHDEDQESSASLEAEACYDLKIRLCKPSGRSVIFHCTFDSSADEVQSAEQETSSLPTFSVDMVEVEKIPGYFVDTDLFDDNMYDHIMRLLAERGVDYDFQCQLQEFATSEEHELYRKFLQEFQAYCQE
ncbi:hypothetical protein Aperf_G00000130954 [Anoplocephala perfoliata]